MSAINGYFKSCLEEIKAGNLSSLENKNGEIKRIVNYYDETGRTMLHWTAFLGHKYAVLTLLNHGANALLVCENDDNFQPIHFATVNNHTDCIQLLLDVGVSIESCDMFRRSPLSIACFYGRINATVFLLSKGANIEHRDMNGNNLLHFAAMSDSADLCQILIYSGIDVRLKNDLGETAFHIASCKGSPRLLKSLLAVDPLLLNDTDNKHLTGLSHAKFHRNQRGYNYIYDRIKKSSKIIPSLRRKDFIYGRGGSKYPLIFLVVAIFFWALPTYVAHILFLTYSDYPTLNCLFIIFALGFMISLYAVNSVSPGFLPRCTREYDDALKNSGLRGSDTESELLIKLSRLCHTCRTVKPLRASHCSICRRCVRDKDHHCPYVYNCIGFRNRAYFLSFLVCLWTTMTFGVILSAVIYYEFNYRFLIHEYFGLVLLAIFYVFVNLILVSTVIGALGNLTTNESLKWTQYGYDYLRDGHGRFRNRFNKGYFTNFLEYFRIMIIYTKRNSSPLDI